jgi:hypothetical protein
METKKNNKNLVLIGLMICCIGSISLLIEMFLNWKNDLRDVTIPALWTMVTLQYYYNWKTK